MNAICLLASLVMQAPPEATPAKLVFSATIERPRPTDYGVLPEALMAVPLVFMIEPKAAPGHSLECREDAALGVAKCTFDENVLAAGEYTVTVVPTTPPSEGNWAIALDVPVNTERIQIKAVASLRIHRAGLALESAVTFSTADPRVVVSSRTLASRPFLRESDLNGEGRRLSDDDGLPLFEITNGLDVPIILNAWDGHAVGEFAIVGEGKLQDADRGAYCGTGIQPVPLAPGATMPAGEAWVMGTPRPFGPGQYRYSVFFQRDGEPQNMKHVFSTSMTLNLVE